MSTTAIPTLARQLADVVTTVIFEARPKLIEAALSGEHGESQNLRHAGNFLSVHDIWAHGRYLELLAPQVPAFVYASEEAEPQVVGPEVILLERAHRPAGLFQDQRTCGVVPELLPTVQVQVYPTRSDVTPFQRASAVIALIAAPPRSLRCTP